MSAARGEEAWQQASFALRPFGTSPSALGLELNGSLRRHGDRLEVRYGLRGELASVLVPPPGAGGARRADGLWEHTCFELFLAAEETDPYWEVNLAPNGDWNLYRLEGYRQGLAPVADREALPFAVRSGPEALELTLPLQLPVELALACETQALRVGVTAVIEQTGGALSYWALAHGGTEADFHRREDYLLRLKPG